MEQEILRAINDWGSAGIIIVVVLLFLRFLKEQMQRLESLQNVVFEFQKNIVHSQERIADLQKQATEVMLEISRILKK